MSNEVVTDERFELAGTVIEVNALIAIRMAEIESKPGVTVLSFQAKAYEYIPNTGGHVWRVKIQFSEDRM